MASIAKRVAKIPFAPVVALLFAAAIAILVAAAPQWRLEQAVAATGLDHVVSMAKPPLGMKARAAAVIAAFLIVGFVLWLVIGLIERALTRPRPAFVPVQDDSVEEPHVEKAAAEPSRRPIFADSELGAPLMSDAALTTVAPPVEAPAIEDADLEAPVGIDDAPLILEAPEPVTPVEPDVPASALPPIADAPELQVPISIEEFDLPAIEEEPAMVEGESSIDALIRRLEAGLARRGNAPQDPKGPGSATAEAAPLTLSSDWVVLPPEGESASNDDDDQATRSAMATLLRMAKR